MFKFILGTGIGWILGGPIGAIIGSIVGLTLMDSTKSSKRKRKTKQGDILLSIIVLAASVMKSDGRIMKSELDFVRQYLTHYFGREKSNELIVLLKAILEKDYSLNSVCEQIRDNTDDGERLVILQFLFGIAYADTEFNQEEEKQIREVAALLDIEQEDYDSIQTMFMQNSYANYQQRTHTQQGTFGMTESQAYQILEIDQTATDQELKKSYRRLAMKYHPDKVSHLGEQVRKAAEEKIIKLNEAYSLLKTIRGLK